MRALLRKEWREHRWALLAMLVLLAVAHAALLMGAGTMGSPMVAYQKITVLMAPMMALILARRLVVREYMGRTQLFLETLPVSRVQVLALKWLLGAAVLLLAMAACLGIALLAARGKVLLTPRYVELVAIRSASFIMFAYTLAFLIGLTGRYRYVLWSALVAGAFMADTAAQLALGKWPPFLLVQQAMIYERLNLPLSAVLATCAITAGLIVATLLLALSAEGSLVVALSRRMSSREKSAVAIGFVGLILATSLIETRKPKPPFVLQNAARSNGSARGPAVAVGIAGAGAQSRQLANTLSDDLAGLQAFFTLQAGPAPALAALPDDSLDGDVFQRAVLPAADGVVVRAAFTDSQFDQAGFRAYAMAAWLQWYSRGLAGREERRWLLDGTAQWLAARGLPDQEAKLALRAALAARLLHGYRRDASSALHQWLTVREELGACLGDALAWRMVASLAQQLGEPRFAALGKAALTARAPADARAMFEPGLAQLLVQAGAPDQAAMARQFDALFLAEQARLAEPLSRIALPKVRFTAQRMQGSTYEVHYTVADGPRDTLPFSVRYLALGPWDGEIAPELPARIDTARDGVLPASYPRGARIFSAVERRDVQLGCSIRLAAQRWEVR